MSESKVHIEETYLRISVVIPAYNVVSCIGRAIDSVLEQTISPLEIIVVDDGSNDNLEEYLTRWSDDRLRYYRQSNSGAAAARNYGVSVSSGELIAFLDADDFWHTRKLERQLSAFQDIDNLGLCYTDYVVVQNGDPEHTTFSQDVDAKPRLIADFSEIFSRPYFGTPGVMLRREFFDEVGGFDQRLKKAEDVDLWLRFAYRYKVAHIPLSLWAIVIRSDGLSSSGGQGGFADNLKVIDAFCRAHSEFADSHCNVVAEAVRDVYMQWGRATLAGRKLAESRRQLWAAFKIRPSLEVVYLILKTILPSFVRSNN